MGEGRESRPPPMPPQQEVFSRQQFLKFADLYLKVGYVLGGFQALNSINFELVREEMFGGKQETGEGAASDEGMDEVYEDEEMELEGDVGVGGDGSGANQLSL